MEREMEGERDGTPLKIRAIGSRTLWHGATALRQGEPFELHMRDGPRKRWTLKRAGACPWPPTGARAESRLAAKTERAGDRPTEVYRVMMARLQMVARRPTADGGACWLQLP